MIPLTMSVAVVSGLLLATCELSDSRLFEGQTAAAGRVFSELIPPLQQFLCLICFHQQQLGGGPCLPTAMLSQQTPPIPEKKISF